MRVGGASGIGCAVGSRVIAEGGLITLWDVDQAKLDAAQAKFGPKVRAKRVDITNPEEVERAAKDAEAAMGHIDILVCSAGVAGLNADVVDYRIDEWRRVFDVNINAVSFAAIGTWGASESPQVAGQEAHQGRRHRQRRRARGN